MQYLLDRIQIYIVSESNKLYNWARSGDSAWTILPTLLWSTGAISLAHRLVTTMFRRYIFRRIPLWEQILQQLLFIWMVIYSLHLWTVLVQLAEAIVEYYYHIDMMPEKVDMEDGKIWATQGLIWILGVTPLIIFIQMRTKRHPPPLMIWIRSPWQRQEMGAYGYYLNRPPSSQSANEDLSIRIKPLRRAYSESKIINKDTAKKRRYSKSC